MKSQQKLRIGTRGSPLALFQARLVADLLAAAHPDLDPDAIELTIIQTSGDRIRDRPLAEIGGKGLFTKEIEEALLGGDIDLAVHSYKDVPTLLPPGLAADWVLERADPRDAFISRQAACLAELPPGAVVGTASPRRQAQVRAAFPALRVASLRGNVETRLRKLAAGEVDATLLACAGLRRLGRAEVISSVIDPGVMLPAVAQGIIAIEARAGDTVVADRLAPLNHAPTRARADAERAMLAALGGSCQTPVAALADIVGADLSLRAALFTPDGAKVWRTSRRGPVGDAVALGGDAGAELKRRAGVDFPGDRS